MRWIQGDLIDVATKLNAHVLGFTANSVITKNGKLVMGGGAAKRVRDYFDGVDAELGKNIGANLTDFLLAEANVSDLIVDKVLAIQVKRHFKDDGDLDLTKQALEKLKEWSEKHPSEHIVINCPLIGLGGFANEVDKIKKEVESVLGSANITVCTM